MLKKEVPWNHVQRCKLYEIWKEKDVSFGTKLALSEYMAGLTDEGKERIAEQLCEIISASNSEEEMLRRAESVFDNR